MVLDYWAPLHPGDTDPAYVDNDGIDVANMAETWCNEESPVDSWYCSRMPGHPGPHVASDTDAVLEVWGEGLPREMQLPEGF